MALTAREQFRLGFLTSCAKQGLKPEEIKERVKAAHSLVKAGFVDMQKLLSLYTAAPAMAAGYGLLTSAGAGAIGGYTAAKLTDDNVDPDEAKRQELIAVYRQHAERARRNASRIRYRQGKSAPAKAKLF